MESAQPISKSPGDWFVYLVWDASPEEHGEKPDLVCVFATEEMAQAFIDESYEEEESDHIAIQQCQVVGSVMVTMQLDPIIANGTIASTQVTRWPTLTFGA